MEPPERGDEGLAGTPSGGVEGVASEESGRTIDGIINSPVIFSLA